MGIAVTLFYVYIGSSDYSHVSVCFYKHMYVIFFPNDIKLYKI